jgi:hypothetical protein
VMEAMEEMMKVCLTKMPEMKKKKACIKNLKAGDFWLLYNTAVDAFTSVFQ